MQYSLYPSSSDKFRRYEPVHSYREQKYFYQLTEISYKYEYLYKPRSSLHSLEAACPIVFSISELVYLN